MVWPELRGSGQVTEDVVMVLHAVETNECTQRAADTCQDPPTAAVPQCP